MRIILNDVTVCAIDSINPSLALRAIKICQNNISFGDSIIFSDVDTHQATIRQIKVNKIRSKNEYSKFLLKELSQHINTSHTLVVQWDGYVTAPKSWNSNFLKFDYIGAEWDWHKDGMNVGNGGFSLRSKRLLNILSSDEFPFIENVNEDEQICRVYRERLEKKFNINFAPTEIANQFAYERGTPKETTFGFHGLFNMWRHVDDIEMINLINQLDPNSLSSIEYYELIATYYSKKNLALTKFLYSKLKNHYQTKDIIMRFLDIIQNHDECKNFIIDCESLAREEIL